MKRKKFLTAIVIFLLIALPAFSGFGCQNKTAEKTKSQSEEIEKEADSNEEGSQDVTGKRKVLMMGRSVMGGWFEHWGSDSSYQPVKRDDFILYYKELEVPPKIVDSAERYLDEVEDKNTIVFFKFCFDDFEGSSKSEAKANLAQNKKYVQEVYDLAVKEHGLKLIIGNALPRVKIYTESPLVWHHRAFNDWLEKFAQEHPDEVYVFDQYSILTDADGNLRKEYALDREDSHLNDEAYSALDDSFFNFLEENFKN